MIKKIKQIAPYYTCRKTCHLMSRDKTLKNIHKGREIKKLDGRNSSTENINYAATCEIHDGIYAGNTAEELRERFSKHRYDAKNRPDNNEFAAHIHKHQHEFDKDIEGWILKENLHQKHERELWEYKFLCLLGTKALSRLSMELKHCRPELYEVLIDLTV